MKWLVILFSVIVISSMIDVGSATGFGDGRLFVFGDDDIEFVPEPNEHFIEVDLEGGIAIGLKVDGSVVTWGWAGSNPPSVPEPNAGYIAIDAGSDYNFAAVRADGSIVVWPQPSPSCGNILPEPNIDFVAVEFGGRFLVGLKSDGEIVFSGDAYCDPILYPLTDIPGTNSDFVKISLGDWHLLGLKSNGQVVAWGVNNYGQCDVPAYHYSDIAAGSNFSLGVLSSQGSIVGWGLNHWGQCNIPSPNSNFQSVAAGDYHGAGLKEDSSIVTWGFCMDGNECNVPEPNSGFVKITADYFSTAGIRGHPITHFLADPTLDPPSGYSGDVFTWSVLYSSSINVPPIANLRLFSPSGNLSNYSMSTSDSTFGSGARFSCSISLNEVGNYRYDFPFIDGEGNILLLRDDDGGFFDGPSVAEPENHLPVLSTESVFPPVGSPGTEFVFSINYSDQENDFPVVAILKLKNNSSSNETVIFMSSGDLDCMDGSDFSGTAILADVGEYQHQYVFYNAASQYAYMPTDPVIWLAGPVVGNLSAAQDFNKSGAYLFNSVPNPFNPTTTVAFELPAQEAVSLQVFDLQARLVRTLLSDQICPQGRHEAVWDGRDESGRQAASGTYFFRLEAGGQVETKRAVLVK